MKLIFLIVSRAVSLLGLLRREAWWKDAEILMLRHQLAVAGRERLAGLPEMLGIRECQIAVLNWGNGHGWPAGPCYYARL